MWLSPEYRVQWRQNKKLQLFDHVSEWGEEKANELQSFRYEMEEAKTKEEEFWGEFPNERARQFKNQNKILSLLSGSFLSDPAEKFWKKKKSHEWVKVLYRGADVRGFAWRLNGKWSSHLGKKLAMDLRAEALKSGVRIIDEPVVAIHSRNNGIEVHFAKQVETHAYLIVGMPWNKIADRLVHPHAHLENSAPTSWRFRSEAFVHAEAIPEHLSPWLVWTEPGAPTLRLHIDRSKDPVKVELSTDLPITDEYLDPVRLKQISGRMFRKLSELIPYLEFHLQKVNPDFRDMKDLEDVRALIPYSHVSQLPRDWLNYSTASQGIKTRIPRVYRCNRASMTELGFMSAWVSGMKIHAELLSKEKAWNQSPKINAYSELWR